jgi:hypothetical protein
MAPSMTSPQTTPGGIETNSRGIAVLVVALVVGFLLLLNAGGGAGASSDDDTATPPADTTNLVDGSTSTTSQPGDLVDSTSTTLAEDARTPGDVTVAVLNAGGPTGAAATTSAQITDAGWQAGTVGNGSPELAETRIYYTEGYQPEANAVANLLGKSNDAVEAMPETPPGQIADSDNVVVVLGSDTPPTSGADGDTTTTTAATTTTAG